MNPEIFAAARVRQYPVESSRGHCRALVDILLITQPCGSGKEGNRAKRAGGSTEENGSAFDM